MEFLDGLDAATAQAIIDLHFTDVMELTTDEAALPPSSLVVPRVSTMYAR